MSNDAEHLSVDDLYQHLFEGADIIRNKVSEEYYKTYILPLVFYKAIDDTYQDRYEEALEEIGDEDLAKDEAWHDVIIPDEYRWEEALDQNSGLDVWMDKALTRIEKENEQLQGVFNASYSDASAINHAEIKQLIEHLNTKSLSLERVEPDILGEAYMRLVARFASKEGKSGGQFFTPREIADVMSNVLSPDKPSTVYDPTVGSGGLLISMADHYDDNTDGDAKQDLTLKGQEISPQIYPIAKMNLFLHDYNGEVEREDTLSNPQFTEDGGLETFDYLVANPPFSWNWDKDAGKNDPYGRYQWGMARKDRADYAFIQHMIRSLNDSGKMACVIPHGVLFRKYESKYREGMLEGQGDKFDGNIVDAIIGLPENLFHDISIPSALLIIDRDQPVERQDQVLFIHADQESFYEEKSNHNKLTEDGMQQIADIYHDYKTVERTSRAVGLDEIRENDYNLNIALYVDTTEPEEDIDVKEELKELRELQEEREEIEATMTEHMEALGYE